MKQFATSIHQDFFKANTCMRLIIDEPHFMMGVLFFPWDTPEAEIEDVVKRKLIFKVLSENPYIGVG